MFAYIHIYIYALPNFISCIFITSTFNVSKTNTEYIFALPTCVEFPVFKSFRIFILTNRD